MTTQTTARRSVSNPQLVEGDRLTRAEFERRFGAAPHIKKAELVEGVVRMPSPVSTERHAAPHAMLITWLGVYQSLTSGVQVGDNATVRLDWDNELQPDAFLRILPSCGGHSRDEDGYVALAPEWVGEIAASSASYDLHDKKEAYRRNGVREYLAWRVEDSAIDWFILRGGSFDRLEPDQEGIVRSEWFPGLWLDRSAMLAGNLKRVLEIVGLGTASEEHGQFVEGLAARPGK